MDKRNPWQPLIKYLQKFTRYSSTNLEMAVAENAFQHDAKNTTGARGEQRALAYLRAHKLTLIECNYRCSFGEIDLIMRDQDYLVFVEVKQRKHSRYGSPMEMVSAQKQNKLRRSAEYYLNQHRISPDHQAMRFDVVGIVADSTHEESIEWVQNAF